MWNLYDFYQIVHLHFPTSGKHQFVVVKIETTAISGVAVNQF